MNQFLEGDVLLEFRVVSELHCWDHCIRYNYCKAYNYHQTSDPSLENCQLLKSDIGLLKAREGHTYYVIPEQNKDSQVREWSLFVTWYGGEGSEGFFGFQGEQSGDQSSLTEHIGRLGQFSLLRSLRGDRVNFSLIRTKSSSPPPPQAMNNNVPFPKFPFQPFHCFRIVK